MGNSCFQAPCVQIENTSTPPILFLFTLATVACVATKRHEELVQWPDELIPKITGHVRFLRSSLLVIIINQDKNVTLRMKPTALCNLSVLYHWFSRNATNNSRVPHMLEDKSPFTCITSFIACVASVSVLFRTKNEDRAKMARVNGEGVDFCSRFISCAAKTENPDPRSFFALKQHGNACYAGF